MNRNDNLNNNIIFLEKIFFEFLFLYFFIFATKKQIIKIYIIITSFLTNYLIYITSATSDSIIFSYYIIDYVIYTEKKI